MKLNIKVEIEQKFDDEMESMWNKFSEEEKAETVPLMKEEMKKMLISEMNIQETDIKVLEVKLNER